MVTIESVAHEVRYKASFSQPLSNVITSLDLVFHYQEFHGVRDSLLR